MFDQANKWPALITPARGLFLTLPSGKEPTERVLKPTAQSDRPHLSSRPMRFFLLAEQLSRNTSRFFLLVREATVEALAKLKRESRENKRSQVLLYCHFGSKMEKKKRKRTCANLFSCQLTATSCLSPAPSSGLFKASPAAFVKNK